MTDGSDVVMFVLSTRSCDNEHFITCIRLQFAIHITIRMEEMKRIIYKSCCFECCSFPGVEVFGGASPAEWNEVFGGSVW